MTITLTVCGAAGTVTGSCLLFELPGTRFLVDCGMFQGPKTLKQLNYEPFPFEPHAIDFVILTHAHIDHSGLLPKLVRAGFTGRIHATPATMDLCSCMLPDAGHIQEFEVEMLNRRNHRRGKAEVRPIYTLADAERTLRHFAASEYGAWFTPAKGVRARFWNAGHMLGSASLELILGEGDAATRILVSGDIGPDDSSFQPPPEAPTGGIDYVIVESTYGDEARPATDPAARRAKLADIARDTARRGGALLIPSFAVERAQEVIVDLVRLIETSQIPPAPIHLDSPLATRASAVFVRHADALDDGPAIRAVLESPHVHYVQDAAESRALAARAGFSIVLAGSGMCDAGRIRQHLKSRLWDANAAVVLVGYQATGTLGRLLHDGARRVRIQGETIQVAARIASIEGYSAHADGPALGRWLAARAPIAGGAFLVHGEPEAIEGLALRIAGRALLPEPAIIRPLLDATYRLAPGVPAELLQGKPGRHAHPADAARPDWHNDRAALMVGIEEALDGAEDDTTRAAILDRLRRALAD